MDDITPTLHSDIDIMTPVSDGGKPVWWWDEQADRSLLVGIYKHGMCVYLAIIKY